MSISFGYSSFHKGFLWNVPKLRRVRISKNVVFLVNVLCFIFMVKPTKNSAHRLPNFDTRPSSEDIDPLSNQKPLEVYQRRHESEQPSLLPDLILLSSALP